MARMTTRQRRRKLEQCGAAVFGDANGPKARRAGRPRYPLTKVGEGCELSCQAMHDAWKRARTQHENRIAKRIKAKAKRHGCDWPED